MWLNGIPLHMCRHMRVSYKFISTTAMAYAIFGGEFYYEQEVAGSDPVSASSSPLKGC